MAHLTATHMRAMDGPLLRTQGESIEYAGDSGTYTEIDAIVLRNPLSAIGVGVALDYQVEISVSSTDVSLPKVGHGVKVKRKAGDSGYTTAQVTQILGQEAGVYRLGVAFNEG